MVKKMVKERDPVVDIESTGNECKEDSRNKHVTSSKRAQSVLKSLGLALSFKGTDEGDQKLMRTSVDECNDIESLINSKFEGEKKEHNQHVVKTQLKEKHKIRNSMKPPRPRKGPSLTTSDLRLVKEISELVMKKRARIERMKSLKKLRALSVRPSLLSPSSSSSKLSLFSMVVTVLFLIVIIFQGFGSSKSSTLNFSGTLKPSQFGSDPRTMVE